MADISVIIPVFQAERYLRQCLDSVLGQTCSPLEVLLVDDGSTDASGEICREYARKDSRVRCFHQKNSGQAAARNRALKEAQGSWICFVDSDDVIHPRMIELLYRAAVDGQCPISQCRYVEAPELPGDFAGEKEGSFTVLPMDEKSLARLLDQDAYPGWIACAKLIRRELIESYPFREGRVYEDNEAVCRWIVAAKRIADVPEQLYYYRTNPGSTTKGVFSRKSLDYLWALESILKFYGGLGWSAVRDCFLQKYLEAAVGLHRQAKQTPGLEREAGRVERNMVCFLVGQRIPLSSGQIAALLEEMHPRLLRSFWTMCGLFRIAKQEGFTALVRKLRELLGGKGK